MNPEAHLYTDVLIVGKGVSGLVLSYLLEKKGINVTLLNKETNTSKIVLAETIPPSTLALLDQLQLLSVFESCATKTYGYQSIWNSDQIHEETFFKHNPFKHGLKLNKKQLINTLEKQLNSKVINYQTLKELQITEQGVVSKIQLDNNTQTISSKLIIDGTGRNRAVLNTLKIPTQTLDDTIAFICYVPKTNATLKYGFFTETFNDGWGTVSDLNETTRILTIYTSKSNSMYKKLKHYNNWKDVLTKTQVLKKHLPNTTINYKVVGRLANSSIVKKITGTKWLAIGDAAMAFDPISSHGISNALFCAHKASIAIDDFLSKKNSRAFTTYAHTLSTIFKEYYRIKEELYTTLKTEKAVH